MESVASPFSFARAEQKLYGFPLMLVVGGFYLFCDGLPFPPSPAAGFPREVM